ncbi:MAG: HNH endonuclease signature motif containing protein [Candidatus Bathyarchaeia archaeon]
MYISSTRRLGRLGKRGAWEVDHSRPLSRGGTDYLRNLVPSCVECNRSKGDLGTREFGNY